jgi:glycogen debranching enzyme
VIQSAPGGRTTVNLRWALRRYQFDPLRGHLRVDTGWDGERATRGDLTMEGDSWELAIDEFSSTWRPPRRPSFASVQRSARRELAAFTDGLLPVPRDLESTRKRAGFNLWSCIQSPSGLLKREACYMSLNWMDGVWSWDNLFNALALAGTDPALAGDQILLMADHQDEHGAYPDFLSDGYRHYNFSKPPVQGVLFDELRRLHPRWWTPARTAPIRRSVERFVNWWLDQRRWPGQELCHYLHGNDSGWDNSTLLVRGAPLVAPDLNAFLVRCCDWLASVSTGRDAARWRRQADVLTAALVGRLWDGRQFVGIKLPEQERVASQSLVDCMPLLLGRRLPDPVIAALVARIRTFVAPAGVATEQLDSPLYCADGYWRGPVWGPSTLLIVLGLEQVGEQALARDIARRFCATCARSGFAENFDAVTGVGLRDPGYTWTASAFLILAQRLRSNQGGMSCAT